MLAYDSYSKSVIGSVIEQKIRLFLNVRKIVNFPVFKSLSSASPDVNLISDELFKSFKEELGTGPSGVYYEYALSSILIDTPDWDFVTNDESVSIKKAEESFKNKFNKILISKEFFDNADEKATKGTPSLFNFLKESKYQKEISIFAQKIELGKDTNKFLPGNSAKPLTPVKSDILVPTDGKSVAKLMSENDSPFYIEFFYRKRPEINIGEDDREYRYAYFGEGDGYLNFPPFLTTEKYAFRGARLMFNLTSAITQSKTSEDSFGKFIYKPLIPSKFLPYRLNLLNSSGKGDGPRTYVKKFPLPFLSNYQNKSLNSTSVAIPSNRIADSVGDGEPTFLSSVVTKLQIGDKPDNLAAVSPHFFAGGLKNKEDIDKNYFLALKSANTYKDFNNWDYLMWSKSLVCFEIPDVNSESLTCYFPIVVDEFIDTSDNQSLSDDLIVDSLLQQPNVKFLENIIDVEKLTEKQSGPVDIVKSNEKNIKSIFEKYISPVSFGPTTFYPPNNNIFKTIDNASKNLDKTLLNLINLDGE